MRWRLGIQDKEALRGGLGHGCGRRRDHGLLREGPLSASEIGSFELVFSCLMHDEREGFCIVQFWGSLIFWGFSFHFFFFFNSNGSLSVSLSLLLWAVVTSCYSDMVEFVDGDCVFWC